MELTQDDVQQILRLVGDHEIDYLEVQIGDLRLVADRHGTMHRPQPPPPDARPPDAPLSDARLSDARPSQPSTLQPRQQPQQPDPRATPIAGGPEPADSAPAPVATGAGGAGLVQITAPVLGVFYTAPEPGAPPYVEVGSQVDEADTVGLIEVMKMFNGVQAGVRGEVVRILVDNDTFVEHGQPLFDISPVQ